MRQFLGLSWVGIMGDLVDFSSPAVVNGVVYIASLDGNLYAFNANGCGQSSCNPLWVGTMNSNFSSVSSPAVVNGMVYVGSEDHKLYVFAAAGCGHSTCAPLWTASTGGAVFSSPLVAGNTVYVGSEDHRFYAFPANGCGRSTCTPLWTGNTGGAIDSSPAWVMGLFMSARKMGSCTRSMPTAAVALSADRSGLRRQARPSSDRARR